MRPGARAPTALARRAPPRRGNPHVPSGTGVALIHGSKPCPPRPPSCYPGRASRAPDGKAPSAS
jgi:hypothetical protein